MWMTDDHPRDLLDPGWIKIIRDHAGTAERTGRLSAEVLSLIYRENWLGLLIPRSYGGLEWPLPRVVAFFEALGWADGNVGWCVNLGAGANMFAGYLDADAATAIFTGPEIWCAGSGAVSGKAASAPGGYVVSGHWKYASGAAHATHFTANCLISDERRQPLSPSEGLPVRSIIVPRQQVTVFDTWKVSGLKATSSQDFGMDQVFIPEAHVFSLTRPSDFASGPLYRFPFDALAVVNMACMATGITLNFIDLFKSLIGRKKPLHTEALLEAQPLVRQRFESVTEEFYAARREMYEALAVAWESSVDGKPPTELEQRPLTCAARHAAAAGRNVFHALFQYCGMDILYTDSALNKTWRDMATASQHYLLGPLYGDIQKKG